MEAEGSLPGADFQIGAVTVAPARNVLARGAETRALEPRIMDLLCAMAAQPGEVCSREALIDQVWQLQFGGDESLTRAVSILRKSFRELDPTVGEVIETIPKRGYRLALQVFRDAIASTSRVSAANFTAIAVIPFVNQSTDPEQDYFSDGITEDMTTTLSKISGLTVIAPNSTFLFKDRKADAREIARTLGVQFVLEGSVRRSGGRVRITVQLVDGRSGASLWAERYDRGLEDLFALQDEITLIVATELQVKLTEGEQARLRYTTTQNVEVWTLWAQGLAHYRTGVMTPDGSGRARQFWERALELDPNSSNLHAMLANLRVADARLGWWGTREDAISIGMDHARKALAIDPHNADAHSAAGMLLYLQRRFDEAERAARLALEMAPGAADVAAFAAIVLAANGAYDEALVAIERAMRLSPRPPANYFGIQGNVLRLAGKDLEAIAAFQTLSRRNPGFGHLDLAIIYQKQGRADEARAEIEKALNARPRLSVTAFALTQVRRNDEALAVDLEALRAAGLPE